MMIWSAMMMLVCIATLAAQQPEPRVVRTDLAPEIVRGRVVDPRGRPLGGVFVDVLRCDADGFVCGDPAYREHVTRVTRTPTGDDGRFVVHVPIALPCRLHVDHPPFASLTRFEVYGGDEVELRLAHGHSLVVDARDARDAPLDAATVSVRDANSLVELRQTVTDAAGRVSWDRLAAGEVIVVVTPRFDAPPPWQWIRLGASAGAASRAVAHAPHGEKFVGRVVAADDGSPIEGASIGHGQIQQGRVHSLADGTFSLEGFADGRRDYVRISAPGHAAVEVRRSTTLGDIRLPRGVTLRGRLSLTAGGRPSAGYVAAIGASHDEFDRLDWLPARIGDDGEFVIEGLRRESFRYVLMLRHERHGTRVLCVPSSADRDEVAVGQIDLHVRRVLTGRLGDGIGRARASTRLCLVGAAEGYARFVDAATVEQDTMIFATRRLARADAKGRFWFGDLAAGEYALSLGNGTPAERVLVRADSDPAPLELQR